VGGDRCAVVISEMGRARTIGGDIFAMVAGQMLESLVLIKPLDLYFNKSFGRWMNEKGSGL